MVLTTADARERFARECDFPTDQESVVEALGDTEIRAPHGDPTAVESVLDRADETAFETVTELHTTVMTHLDDGHIGRKFYDDRGGQAAGRSVRGNRDRKSSGRNA